METVGIGSAALTLMTANENAIAAALATENNSASSANWHGAGWIGFTEEKRIGKYIERLVHPEKRNEPLMRRAHISSLLRKSFNTDRKVQSAKVMVCGLGLHELYLNGSKVGDRVLVPAPTSYDRRAFYTVHDVTSQITQGHNAIGLMLGNGFYGQDMAFAAAHLQYGEPRARLLLSIEYTDGSSAQIATNQHWKATQSPIIFDNLYAGETYDARLEQPGWSKADFDDSTWQSVERMKAPTKKLSEQVLAPIRKIRSVKPYCHFACRKR